MRDVLGFINDHKEVLAYLPIAKEIMKVPKQWLLNVVGSVCGQPFVKWIKERVVARNNKIVAEQ